MVVEEFWIVYNTECAKNGKVSVQLDVESAEVLIYKMYN